jgi:hypothetical protein
VGLLDKALLVVLEQPHPAAGAAVLVGLVVLALEEWEELAVQGFPLRLLELLLITLVAVAVAEIVVAVQLLMAEALEIQLQEPQGL